MDKIATKNIVKYDNYEVRTEVFQLGSADTMEMESAYNLAGDYIGSPKEADFLVNELGVIPEKSDPSHTVCFVGFCEKQQKWYGWSHRAIFGYGIGSKVTKGSAAYVPDRGCKDELIKEIKANYIAPEGFYEEEKDPQKCYFDYHRFRNVVVEETPEQDGISVSYEYQATRTKEIGSDDNTIGLCLEYIPGVFEEKKYIIKYGKGEWEAKTLEDAKQMAIDFAKGVS